MTPFTTQIGLPAHRLANSGNSRLAHGLQIRRFLSSAAFDSDADSEETPASRPGLSAKLLIESAEGRWGFAYARALRRLDRRYQILEMLGSGGMGEVYQAIDRVTDRPVAIKIAQGEVSKNRLERFRREGQITAALTHPGIVRIHTAGDIDGVPYLVYELVEGNQTLKEVLPQVPLRRRVELIRDAARALGHAHEAGIVHRDVKPANLLVDTNGRLRVADFGLAATRSLSRITRADTLLGTPHYMAPEQILCDRDAVGPTTDVWALGVILYQALTDCLPFDADSIHALGTAILSANPDEPSEVAPGVDPLLAEVCLRALSRESKDRHADGDAFADDLDVYLGDGLRRRRRRRFRWRRLPRSPRLALCVGAALPLLISTALAFQPSDPPDRTAPFVDISRPNVGVTHTAKRSLVVRGSVRDEAKWVEVTVGPKRVRVSPGEPFTVLVPLAIGRNRLRIEAVDSAGNHSSQGHLEIVRLGVPRWYTSLDLAVRPPLPLPQGVVFGSREREYVNTKDGSTLVWVPPAKFVMGDSGSFEDAVLGAGNAHAVEHTRGYFIGKFEVTWGQYLRFCMKTDRTFPRRRFEVTESHPVHEVSWNDATAYCKWAGLRLPTESEWELAARGPGEHVFPWGKESPADAAELFNGEGLEDGYAYSAPVGSFPKGASPYGCQDMAGNVMEWVQDWHGGYSTESLRDPKGPAKGVRRSFRGGCWKSAAWFSRSTYRDRSRPTARQSALGFRVGR